MLKVYPITPFGPLSAKLLKQALELQKPDLVLIQGPLEFNNLKGFINPKELKLPAALILYSNQDKNSFIYPLTSFCSPYIAIDYCSSNQVEFSFIDSVLTLDQNSVNPEEDDNKSTKKIVSLFDYKSIDDIDNIFELGDYNQIYDLLSQMGSGYGQKNLNLKNQITKYYSQNPSLNIAIIVLVPYANDLKEHCDYLAKPILRLELVINQKPGITYDTTFSPWTYSRMSLVNQVLINSFNSLKPFDSVYNPGSNLIISPVWNELVFKELDRTDTVKQFLARASTVLRSRSVNIYPSLTIDAYMLASSLATLRNKTLITLEEVIDSILTVFFGSDQKQMQAYYFDIFVTNTIGHTSNRLPITSLQADINQYLKKFKIQKSIDQVNLTIDLRTEIGIDKSVFFNRLKIVGLTWFTNLVNTKQKGNAKQIWQSNYTSELEIDIVELSIYGTSLEEVCNLYIAYNLNSGEHNLQSLIVLLNKALKADLKNIIPSIFEIINDVLVSNEDPFYLDLVEACCSLIKIRSYGNVYKYDSSLLDTLTKDLTISCILGLFDNSLSSVVSHDKLNEYLRLIIEFDFCIDLIKDSSLSFLFKINLKKSINSKLCNPTLAGAYYKLLSTKEALNTATIVAKLKTVTSSNKTPEEICYWLEGFLSNNATILLYKHTVFIAINEWIVNLSEQDFIDILPTLRRLSYKFASHEVSMLLSKVNKLYEVKIPTIIESTTTQNTNTPPKTGILGRFSK
jgi:Family of unknown function (DUF5682)